MTRPGSVQYYGTHKPLYIQHSYMYKYCANTALHSRAHAHMHTHTHTCKRPHTLTCTHTQQQCQLPLSTSVSQPVSCLSEGLKGFRRASCCKLRTSKQCKNTENTTVSLIFPLTLLCFCHGMSQLVM